LPQSGEHQITALSHSGAYAHMTVTVEKPQA